MKLPFLFVALLCSLAPALVAGCGKFAHASCELEWAFTADCSTVLAALAPQFNPGMPSCKISTIQASYQNYTLDSIDKDNMVITGHIIFSDKYVDTQTISLSASGSGCVATACSTSNSLSYYDYSANFCDTHNIARCSGLPFKETIKTCRFHPDSGKEDSYCDGQ
eukprot:CAMPEP_0177655982 /NCGR_PEP_ID=MMETSP0447-20121125/15285_1 /TAXON_ID=0 /ORGANISM="Stygamoeba regulata, Strain BSH-02190019" /LENGTH=164 /DNA_ID=CAMNT_0019159993 /DNA_START=14 /DNA_END=508 /DNA_ORIENTATION=+